MTLEEMKGNHNVLPFLLDPKLVINIDDIFHELSDEPFFDGDPVMDMQDGCIGVATTITERYVGVKNGDVCEGVFKEFVKKLVPVSEERQLSLMKTLREHQEKKGEIANEWADEIVDDNDDSILSATEIG